MHTTSRNFGNMDICVPSIVDCASVAAHNYFRSLLIFYRFCVYILKYCWLSCDQYDAIGLHFTMTAIFCGKLVAFLCILTGFTVVFRTMEVVYDDRHCLPGQPGIHRAHLSGPAVAPSRDHYNVNNNIIHRSADRSATYSLVKYSRRQLLSMRSTNRQHDVVLERR